MLYGDVTRFAFLYGFAFLLHGLHLSLMFAMGCAVLRVEVQCCEGYPRMSAVTPMVSDVSTGFERVQSFRKSDGSYGAWLHRDSSTW